MHENQIHQIEDKLLHLQQMQHDHYRFFKSRFEEVKAECERELGYASRCSGIKLAAFEDELNEALAGHPDR